MPRPDFKWLREAWFAFASAEAPRLFPRLARDRACVSWPTESAGRACRASQSTGRDGPAAEPPAAPAVVVDPQRAPGLGSRAWCDPAPRGRRASRPGGRWRSRRGRLETPRLPRESHLRPDGRCAARSPLGGVTPPPDAAARGQGEGRGDSVARAHRSDRGTRSTPRGAPTASTPRRSDAGGGGARAPAPASKARLRKGTGRSVRAGEGVRHSRPCFSISVPSVFPSSRTKGPTWVGFMVCDWLAHTSLFCFRL